MANFREKLEEYKEKKNKNRYEIKAEEFLWKVLMILEDLDVSILKAIRKTLYFCCENDKITVKVRNKGEVRVLYSKIYPSVYTTRKVFETMKYIVKDYSRIPSYSRNMFKIDF